MDKKLTSLDQVQELALRSASDSRGRVAELAETMAGALEEMERTGPWLPTSGGRMSGPINMGNNSIYNIPLLTLRSLDGPVSNNYEGIRLLGDTYYFQHFHSTQFYDGYYASKLSIGSPTSDSHAATKKYVDDLVGDIGALLDEINGDVV